jgi:hypothetical protein
MGVPDGDNDNDDDDDDGDNDDDDDGDGDDDNFVMMMMISRSSAFTNVFPHASSCSRCHTPSSLPPPQVLSVCSNP